MSEIKEKVLEERTGFSSANTVDTDRLRLLMQLTGQINSNLDLDSLLLDIMNAAKIITESEASSLIILDEKTDELVVSIPTGPVTAELSGQRFPKDRGIGGWVVTNNEPVIVNNVREDARFLGDFDNKLFTTRNMICVPLVNQDGKVIGALEAINKLNRKSFIEDDLPIFLALANQAAIAIENARLHEERLQKQLLEQQFALAHSIQTGFWPKSTPYMPGYETAGTSRPATWVGGDYYDYITTNDENRFGFVVADVTGKGMPAALLMATVRSVLRAQVENNHPVQETVKRVNRTIHIDTPEDKFITMFYGELDTKTHTFTYVNAGHNNPYLVDFDKQKLTPLNDGGVMLGIMPHVEYEFNAVQIEPGQQLVIFTDGITEAQNERGEFYDEDAFVHWLLNHPDKSPSELITLLLREMELYRGSNPQSDDITLIIIKRNE